MTIKILKKKVAVLLTTDGKYVKLNGTAKELNAILNDADAPASLAQHVVGNDDCVAQVSLTKQEVEAKVEAFDFWNSDAMESPRPKQANRNRLTVLHVSTPEGWMTFSAANDSEWITTLRRLITAAGGADIIDTYAKTWEMSTPLNKSIISELAQIAEATR